MVAVPPGLLSRSLRVLVLAWSLVGCTVDPVRSPEPAPTRITPDLGASGGGTLRVGLAADPHTLDPHFLVDDEGELVVGAVFEPLLRLDERERLVPGAASAWSVDDEGRTVTLTLREHEFHDGTPVTADDVVRSFERLADGTATPPSPLSYLVEPVLGAERAAREGGPLAGVTALDATTIRIELTEPDPRYVLTLADPALVPVPAVAEEEPAAFAVQPVGNGPYRMAEPREPGAFVRLTRVEGHHRVPRVDEILFQIYPDDPGSERQWRDLGDGLLHVADLGEHRVEEALDRYGHGLGGVRGPGVLDGPTGTVTLLAFDVTAPPFDRPELRRAVSQSIDRDALAAEVLGGTAVPATGIVPPSVTGRPVGPCDHCRYDPEGAAALLELDADTPSHLTLTTNRGDRHVAVAERVADDVRAALGIDVLVEPVELADLVPAVRSGERSWFRLGWEANAPDAGNYLAPLFASDGSDNLTGFGDETVDELLSQAGAATDDAEAAALYAEAERLVLDQVPVVPLVVQRRMKVVAPEVRGLVWAPTGRVDLARVTLAARGDGR